jgi:hypothetical protein
MGIDFQRTRFNVALNPGWKFDSPYFGLRAGAWFGYFQMTGFGKRVDEVFDYEGDLGEIYAFPQFGMRVGPSDIFYFDMHLADLNPAMAAPIMLQGGFGTGLGKKNGAAIEAGFSSIGPYAYGVFPIRDKFKVSAYVSSAFGMKLFNTYDNTCVSVGIHYRLPEKSLAVR